MGIDIVVILIIAVSTFLAYRKGFIELSVNLVATLIAIVIAFIFTTPLTNFVINNTEVDEYIEDVIIEKSYSLMNIDEEDLGDKVVKNVTGETITKMAETTSENLVKIGVSLILYTAIRTALYFVKIIGRLVAKIPGIKQINGIGGIIYGLIRGVALIYIVLLVTREMVTLMPNEEIEEKIESTSITKMMYNNNLFDALVDTIEI